MPAISLGCMQLWRRFLTNTKISFVENDAKCAQKHKTEIEKVAQGKVYVGEAPWEDLFPSFTLLQSGSGWDKHQGWMSQVTRQTLLC